MALAKGRFNSPRQGMNFGKCGAVYSTASRYLWSYVVA